MTDMTTRIREKINIALNPTQLEVVNESYKHQGHAGDDGSGESHFNISISSPLFEGKSRLAKERMIYKALESEMKIIHALSITIQAP